MHRFRSPSTHTAYCRCLSVLLLLIICIALPSVPYAQNVLTFSDKLNSWESTLQTIETALDRDSSMEQEGLERYQSQLRTIRTEADLTANEKKEALQKEKDLLKALGDPPENAEDEKASIRKDRKRLNETISSIDAQRKQARLATAKAEELLSALDEVQKQQLRNKLLARDSLPIQQEDFTGFLEDLRIYTHGFNQWGALALISVAVLIIGGISIPINRHVNTLFEKAEHIQVIRSFSRTRLAILAISALFVFLLRFNILNITTLPLLEYLIRLTASIALASILFLALGKIRFLRIEPASNELGESKRSYVWLWNGLRNITRAILITVPFMSLAGYTNLGLYLSFNILITLAALLMFAWLRQLVVFLNKKAHPPQIQNEQENLSPLAITVIEPILALLMLATTLFFWGLTSEDVTTWVEQYKHGIPIGDITINFSSIGAAIALFFALYVATKVIQWFLSSRVFPYTQMNIGIRDAILAITGYIGILIALLAGMSSIGLDLSNLAIVAGALSVGIGFGLQAIFNNFVSGLILLFERPVKVGDWVIVGEYQGIIKKIRVRSTEIETFQNASIIVPNSQLISETVTNWTLHDRVGRVDIAIGVAYGSDTDKVREVLLQTAKDHPQVRNYPSPNVYFMNFGDSSLDFELRCFIRNIRDIFWVSSELRFAVDKAFREHDITIPFPQRDLHIITPGSPIEHTPSPEGESPRSDPSMKEPNRE